MERILINKNLLPFGFSTIVKRKLRRAGYKGISQAQIFYTANTGGGLDNVPILKILTSIAVNNYQHKYMRNGKRISDK